MSRPYNFSAFSAPLRFIFSNSFQTLAVIALNLFQKYKWLDINWRIRYHRSCLWIVDNLQTTEIIVFPGQVVKQMDEPKQSLKQIRNKSLREHTLDMLRQAILLGELKPGESLVETDLAERLGVSRAPIREALQILDKEGLVEIIPYHGTTVRNLTRTDIEELYSMRILLEIFAVKRMIAQGNPDHVTRLRNYYNEMLKAGKAGDFTQMNAIDRVFHDSLIEMGAHSLLVSMWQLVAMKVQQVMALRNLRNTDIMQIAHNHLPIIDAIAAQDAGRAIPLLEEHIASVGDLIAEDWRDDELGGAL